MIRFATAQVTPISKSCLAGQSYSTRSVVGPKIDQLLTGRQENKFNLASEPSTGPNESSEHTALHLNTQNEDQILAPHALKRRHLPSSPFLTPEFYDTKRKHHSKKPLPSGEKTDFQKQLYKNPYALALASPIRQCRMTEMLLPKFFLQDYRMIAHPVTGKSWFMPRSLTRKDGSEKRAEYTSNVGPTQYTLGSRKLLQAMQNPLAGYFRLWSGAGKEFAHTVPFQEAGYQRHKKAVKSAATRFRPDMPDFVLELMRRRTVEGLVQLVELQRGYLVGCTSWDDALAKSQVAAFLWTGGIEGPAEFATLDVGSDEIGQGLKKKRKVPVHNLHILLGEEKLVELKGKKTTGIFDSELVVLKHKKMTVELEMKLWRLQGYLAEYNSILDRQLGYGGHEPEDELEGEEETI